MSSVKNKLSLFIVFKLHIKNTRLLKRATKEQKIARSRAFKLSESITLTENCYMQTDEWVLGFDPIGG